MPSSVTCVMPTRPRISASGPSMPPYDAKEIETLCRPDSRRLSAHSHLLLHPVQPAPATACRHACARQRRLERRPFPIGISRNSVEAWKESHYFNLNGQAGAPPDDFSVNGQNWGLPTCQLGCHGKRRLCLVDERFHKMAEYLMLTASTSSASSGIWEIPMHAVHGAVGRISSPPCP